MNTDDKVNVAKRNRERKNANKTPVIKEIYSEQGGLAARSGTEFT